MKAKIDKEFEVVQGIDQVWDFFSNPSKVVTCVPGAQITEQIDETNYKGTVTIKIGPVKTSYKGKITLIRLDKDNFDMEIHGKGVDTKGKGSASMILLGKLTKTDAGTSATTSMELTITGKLAQFGARMIVDVSNQIFGQFVDNMKGKLVQEAEALAPETSSVATDDVQNAVAESEPVTKTSTPVTPVAPKEEEVKPISALPLFFKVLGGSITRFFRKLFGIKSKK